jgi:hypothetical protein
MARRYCVSAVICRGQCGRFSGWRMRGLRRFAQRKESIPQGLPALGYLEATTALPLPPRGCQCIEAEACRTRVNENEENDDALEA